MEKCVYPLRRGEYAKDKYYWQWWITRLAGRGRTQLAALTGVKCRTRRALDIRTHIAVVSPSHNFVCLSVVENENKLQDLLRIDSLIVNSSGHPNLNVYSQYYHRLRAWTILVDLKRRSRCVCVFYTCSPTSLTVCQWDTLHKVKLIAFCVYQETGTGLLALHALSFKQLAQFESTLPGQCVLQCLDTGLERRVQQVNWLSSI